MKNDRQHERQQIVPFVAGQMDYLLKLRSNVKVESTGHVPDAKTQEQQFFLARRIPSCLWREASKSPIRRAYGPRLISRRVVLEVGPPLPPTSLSIFTLHNYVPSGIQIPLVVGITIPVAKKTEDEDTRGRDEREKGTSICYITRINNYSGAQQLL